jgi:hypothetical protein
VHKNRNEHLDIKWLSGAKKVSHESGVGEGAQVHCGYDIPHCFPNGAPNKQKRSWTCLYRWGDASPK